MAAIIPPQTKFIMVPDLTGDQGLSPTMAVTMALAYEDGQGPVRKGVPRSLSHARWTKLMNPDECRSAGLRTWSPSCRSKTKAALSSNGLMSLGDGEYLVMRPWPFLRLPWMILAHPDLTVSMKVHWARYVWSAGGQDRCVPAWCGPNHSGPTSKSHALHAKEFLRCGLATASSGCYRLIPLDVVAGYTPDLLTAKLYEAWRIWQRRKNTDYLMEILQRRDDIARSWSARLSQGDNQEVWERLNSELSLIAKQARSRRDLLALGYGPDFKVGLLGRIHLDYDERLASLPDPEGITNDPQARGELHRAGQRRLEAALGTFLF